ncbi:SDR family oxidoreductase [Mesorhizobium sp. SB112]|uniref:SDR family NAD(P)-dependent oxidoreductase n=1 Tax=Mesorhizobium sp. SB112 TaxID=3151853 RepID=UPI0032662993
MSDKNKCAVITGGASGIGLETAVVLKEQGWTVYLLDRNTDALADACKEVGIDGTHGIACSVTDEAEIDAAIADIAASGNLAAIVNSAGIGMDKPAVDTSVEEFRRIVDINLTGTFIVARAAARHWIATKTPGAIVNISSVSGMIGNKGRSAYGSSKGAVNMLTAILATELGQQNIRVNAVAPGAVDTPLSRAVHTDDVRAQWHERIPQRRYGTAREIASTVAFLVSDEASYINGQVIAVDGGFVTSGLSARV